MLQQIWMRVTKMFLKSSLAGNIKLEMKLCLDEFKYSSSYLCILKFYLPILFISGKLDLAFLVSSCSNSALSIMLPSSGGYWETLQEFRPTLDDLMPALASRLPLDVTISDGCGAEDWYSLLRSFLLESSPANLYVVLRPSFSGFVISWSPAPSTFFPREIFPCFFF